MPIFKRLGIEGLDKQYKYPCVILISTGMLIYMYQFYLCRFEMTKRLALVFDKKFEPAATIYEYNTNVHMFPDCRLKQWRSIDA